MRAFLFAITLTALGPWNLALGPSASAATGPLVLQMADGSYYHPASGQSSMSREELLAKVGAPANAPVVSFEPIPVPPADTRLQDAITRGRALLQSRIDEAKKKGTKAKIVASPPSAVYVTLAVWEEATDKISKIVVRKQGMKVALLSSEVDTPVTVRRDNGVNSEYNLRLGLKTVAVDYTVAMIQPSGKYALEDVVYTPYSRLIHTPEIVAAGRKALDGMIDRAYEDLVARKVMSLTYRDRPLVDVIPKEFAKAIILIEHVSPAALVGTETPERAVEQMYVTVAVNGDAAYAYSRSPAGAKGMVQFIPTTYKSMTRFTGLGLDPNFETAMTKPVNAIKAEVAYLDTELASMPLSVRDLYNVDKFRVLEYLAAAYNGGGARVRTAIKYWGDGWSDQQATNSLRNETIQYIKKLRAAKDILRSV